MSPMAGKAVPPDRLLDVSRLVTAYFADKPDPNVPAHAIAFGTSGHRGSALDRTFNEDHVVAISQAICLCRRERGIDGPLFLGIDTHALSAPAFSSALEVLAANGVETRIAGNEQYTPTPVISHAILAHNRARTSGLADGIVITPSHNPPESGGFKYNPPTGGPADHAVTRWIETTANKLLARQLRGVGRVPIDRALKASTTHRYDFLNTYVNDLAQVVDLTAVRTANVHIGVNPLGGAGVHYWPAIRDRYGLNLEVVNETVDPAFRFMTLDWDGKIRMDPSSSYAMQGLIALRDRFDIAAACDPDHDRHGIVSPGAGLLPPNHYLAVAIDYLIRHRPQWPRSAAIGKTIVSSQMIDRVTAKLGRQLVEMPVGFKWFVAGLLDGSLGFGGEESAGATFTRFDGRVWTTDKDGIVLALLAAEMTARTGRDPGESYRALANELGDPVYTRVDAPATRAQKAQLANLKPQQLLATELAGDRIDAVIDSAPGNGELIGGFKVTTRHGWFAARPSGTEEIYKIYAESFRDQDHLQRIVADAQRIVADVLAASHPVTPSAKGSREQQ